MANQLAGDVEFDREHAVRRVRCPVCGAARRVRCVYPDARNRTGLQPQRVSHTGRYDAAEARGLVPRMVGR